MKKLVLSLVLVNLLTACAYFQKPVKKAKPEAEPVVTAPVTTPASETPAVGGATTADVNAQNLPATEVGAATSAAVADAAKAESTATALMLMQFKSQTKKRFKHMAHIWVAMKIVRCV